MFNRGAGQGNIRSRQNLPPNYLPGATHGQAAAGQKFPPTGEVKPPPPTESWVRRALDYLVDRVSIRMVTEFYNLRHPVYQPPWVENPFTFEPLVDSEGFGTAAPVFVPAPLPPGGAWVNVLAVNVPERYRGILNRFGFNLNDPLAGPVNIPYQCTSWRFQVGNRTVYGPFFGQYGTGNVPVKFPICHVFPGEQVNIQFANFHNVFTWNIAARVEGWRYKVTQETGKNASIGIVD